MGIKIVLWLFAGLFCLMGVFLVFLVLGVGRLKNDRDRAYDDEIQRKAVAEAYTKGWEKKGPTKKLSPVPMPCDTGTAASDPVRRLVRGSRERGCIGCCGAGCPKGGAVI